MRKGGWRTREVRVCQELENKSSDIVTQDEYKRHESLTKMAELGTEREKETGGRGEGRRTRATWLLRIFALNGDSGSGRDMSMYH